MKNLITIICLGLILCGCAKSGDNMPPITAPPKSAAIQQPTTATVDLTPDGIIALGLTSDQPYTISVDNASLSQNSDLTNASVIVISNQNSSVQFSANQKSVTSAPGNIINNPSLGFLYVFQFINPNDISSPSGPTSSPPLAQPNGAIIITLSDGYLWHHSLGTSYGAPGAGCAAVSLGPYSCDKFGDFQAIGTINFN